MPHTSETRSGLADEILHHLAQCPHAQDTLDGIAQWWRLERGVAVESRTLTAALNGLRRGGRIVAIAGRDGRTYYRRKP